MKKSGITFRNFSGDGFLTGQFQFGCSSFMLPLKVGKYQLSITVTEGSVNLNHGEYCLERLEADPKGRPRRYELSEPNSYCIEVDIRSVDGVIDRLILLNPSLLKITRFTITIDEVL